jgi:hypothetical protein
LSEQRCALLLDVSEQRCALLVDPSEQHCALLVDPSEQRCALLLDGSVVWLTWSLTPHPPAETSHGKPPNPEG